MNFNRLTIKIFFILYITKMLSTLTYCSIAGFPVGAKYVALGGQITTTDDVYSVYYNPASVDFVQKHQIAFEYTGMFLGINENIYRAFLGYALPTSKIGSFGIYWMNFQATEYYSENTVAFAYSKDKFLIRRLSFGLRPKLYYISYGKYEGAYDNDGIYQAKIDTALQNINSKSAFSLDVGFNFKLAQNYILGLQINDLLEPNISLFNTPDVVVARKILFGISNINKTYGLNLDIAIKDKDFISAFGIQYKMFNEKLKLYGSVKFTNRTYTLKSVGVIEPSFGAEYSFDGFSLAYAFNYPISGLNTFGNHTFSLSYKFGPVVKLPEDVGPLYAKISKLEEQLKQKDAEIEELKRKLDELLSKPVVSTPKTEKPKEKPSVKVTTPTVPSGTTTQTTTEKEMSPKEKFESLFNKYLEKKQEISFVDRIKTVEALIRQFKGQTDISKAQKELNDLIKEQNKAKDELNTTKGYYFKLKSAGTSKAELRQMLEKIKKKYSEYGLDINWIEEELKQLE